MEGEGMSEELKPCSACGASRGLYVLYDEHDMEWFVFCDNCKTSICNEHNDKREDAVRTWNRRAERTCRMDYNEQWSHDEYYPTECYNCSECGHMTYDGVPTFCPNCGAKVTDE